MQKVSLKVRSMDLVSVASIFHASIVQIIMIVCLLVGIGQQYYNQKQVHLDHGLSQQKYARLTASSAQEKPMGLQDRVMLGKVVELYDGDSLKLNVFLGEQLVRVDVRMDGFDSAQIRSNVPEVKEVAVLLRDKLREMLLGKVVKAKFGKNDKYGRALATITVKTERDEKELNGWLIENRLVKTYSGGTKEEYTRSDASSYRYYISNTPSLRVVSY